MTRKSYSAAVASNLRQAASQNMASSSSTQPPNQTTAQMHNSGVIDPYHPYFLQTSDNPGIALVTQSLTAHNYHQWNRSVRLALSAKNKLGMVDGTLPRPVESSNLFPFWHRCNYMVLSWLLNSMSSEIRDSVVYFSTAREIWDDLAVRFTQGNVPRIFQLKKELTALTQGNLSITAYFTKCRTLTDELNALSPLPKCTCATNTCNCGLTGKLDAYEKLNSLSQFLMGLSDAYTSTRGQILMLQPLPTLSQAYSLLLQEKGQRENHSHSSVVESLAMNVKTAGFKNRAANQQTSKKSYSAESEVCEYCQNPGHSKDKCFFLHGYPEWHRLHGKPKPRLKQFGGNSTVKKVANVTSKSNHDMEIKSVEDNKAKETFTEAQCE